jgi:hypothetical protein
MNSVHAHQLPPSLIFLNFYCLNSCMPTRTIAEFIVLLFKPNALIVFVRAPSYETRFIRERDSKGKKLKLKW